MTIEQEPSSIQAREDRGILPLLPPLPSLGAQESPYEDLGKPQPRREARLPKGVEKGLAVKRFVEQAEQKKRELIVRYQYNALFNLSVHAYFRSFWAAVRDGKFGEREVVEEGARGDSRQ